MRQEILSRALALEDRAACQQLIGDEPDEVEVSLRAYGLRLRLLGRHIAGRADGHPFPGQGREMSLLIKDLGDPEIEELDDVFTTTDRRAKDVLRFEVSVDHPSGVRLSKPIQRLYQVVHHTLRFEGRLMANDVLEGVTFKALHDEVEEALVSSTEVMNLDDIRVPERRDRARLALKALHLFLVVSMMCVKQLDRHRAPNRELLGPIDSAKSSTAQHRVDAIALLEDLADEGIVLGRQILAQINGLSPVHGADRGLGLLATLWTNSQPHTPRWPAASGVRA